MVVDWELDEGGVEGSRDGSESVDCASIFVRRHSGSGSVD